ncbi:unnamed protein product [Lactuca virosa]|uniref:Uncharacterized protein n=1 Tax=Lactuca virosa TaxID=75947 RepID=A0AAU9LFQ6_9ASTR|nr:unnamed protein product [Lactuca virosa]
MRRQWKRTKNIFKDYWKKNGGMTDPQLARSKMKPDCRSEEDWGYLCDYWESDKAKRRLTIDSKSQICNGWEASSGPVMRKKDIHLLSTAETSQSASKDEEDMKSKIVALEEEVRINEQKVKQSEEKCEKMFQFIISKFPDSQNILCPPDEDEARAYDDITDLL